MKKLLPILLIVLAAACAGGPNKVTHDVAAGINGTAEAAIGAFSDYEKTHKIDADTYAKVNTAIRTFRAADHALIDAKAALDLAGSDATAQAAAQGRLDLASREYADAANAVIELIRTINPKAFSK